MGEHIGDYEHGAHDPIEINLPDLNVPQNWLEMLGRFLSKSIERQEKHMSTTADALNNLYETIGNDDETASMIISYLQLRHKWDIELLAVKSEVEEKLFNDNNVFDEHIWEKVINTTAISDLHHEVYKLSQQYIAYALEEVLDNDEADRDSSDEEELF